MIGSLDKQLANKSFNSTVNGISLILAFDTANSDLSSGGTFCVYCKLIM